MNSIKSLVNITLILKLYKSYWQTNIMNFEKIYVILLFLLVILINLNSINLPYYWDDFNYVAPAIEYVFNKGPTIFLWEQGLGHPPFLFILGGLAFKLFGD